jgi:Domain of unknown function (DUF6471)
VLAHVTVCDADASYLVTAESLVKHESTPYDDTSIMERDMPERTDWEERAKGIIRGEMARRGITYAQLVQRLEAIGIDENERNLRNKVSRGKFTAGFLLQCLVALGVSDLRLG